MFTHAIWWAYVALGALFISCSTYSQELNGVAQQYLQRHGVPCLFVLTVDSSRGSDEAATCEDGREWALFWLEDEIAFVHPQTRELYKWDRQIYMSYPEVYLSQNLSKNVKMLSSNGP